MAVRYQRSCVTPSGPTWSLLFGEWIHTANSRIKLTTLNFRIYPVRLSADRSAKFAQIPFVILVAKSELGKLTDVFHAEHCIIFLRVLKHDKSII
jgi:hypothetical protein